MTKTTLIILILCIGIPIIYVYYVLIDGNEYELTHDKNKIKIFTTGLFGSGTEKIQFYTDEGQFIESNNFTYKKILKDNNK